MKFKIAVITLLTAIFSMCLFTSYTLIEKANKQYELQKLQAEIGIKTFFAENASRILNERTVEGDTYYELWDKYNEIQRKK